VWNSNCNGWQARSYLQFDLSTLPASHLVTDVRLLLYTKVGNAYGYQLSSTTMTVQPVTQAWNEMAVTYNTRPTVGAVEASTTFASVGVTGTWTNPSFEGYINFNITQLYKDWQDGTRPNFGVATSRPTAICENGNFNYTKSSDDPDSRLRPALVITYVSDDPPPPQSPSCAGVSANLVSCWSADGNANDSIGANHGTLHNGVAFGPGVIDQAFTFDGVNDYVRVLDSPTLDITSQLSVATWFKSAVDQDLGGGLVDKTVTGGDEPVSGVRPGLPAGHTARQFLDGIRRRQQLRRGELPGRRDSCSRPVAPLGRHL
jgi:hypothetical protein